jgi:hypothetical protein
MRMSSKAYEVKECGFIGSKWKWKTCGHTQLEDNTTLIPGHIRCEWIDTYQIRVFTYMKETKNTIGWREGERERERGREGGREGGR